MEDLDNLSEEELQQLIALGSLPDEQNALQDQIKQAQMIRNRQAPQGTQAGRVYVAANPLEHLAYAMQGIKADRDIKNLRSQQQDVLRRQNEGRMSYLDALLGRLRMGKGGHAVTMRSPGMQDIDVDQSLVPSPRGY